MANSKHAHLRYNILDYCFKNKKFSFDELLKYINLKISEYYPGEGISIRTLREDIKLFRDKENGFGAPLPSKARVLCYTDTNFSIATRPLLEYENYLLEASQQLLTRFENHPKYDRLSEALIKFQDEEEQDNDTTRILLYDHNEEYKGIKHLKPLYLAIKNKQVLSITFKGFKNTESRTFEFHPYILKQYNRRWFVYGLHKSKDIPLWSIPLDDRLIDFEIIEDATYDESNTDWDSFFREMIGVVRPKDALVETVVLKFYNGREQYFKTKPFHPDFDEFNEEDKDDQVFFEAIVNRELVQQILSYGGDVEVLKPESLKEMLKDHIMIMKDFYLQ